MPCAFAGGGDVGDDVHQGGRRRDHAAVSQLGPVLARPGTADSKPRRYPTHRPHLRACHTDPCLPGYRLTFACFFACDQYIVNPNSRLLEEHAKAVQTSLEKRLVRVKPECLSYQPRIWELPNYENE